MTTSSLGRPLARWRWAVIERVAGFAKRLVYRVERRADELAARLWQIEYRAEFARRRMDPDYDPEIPF